MSKKTRKKSSKTAPEAASARRRQPAKTPGKTRRASQAGPPRKTAKKAATKLAESTAKTVTRRPSASRPDGRKPIRAKAAHKPASKQLQMQARHRPQAGCRTAGLVEGAKAPAFRLPRDGGDTVSLSDYSGQKLVLFFYPRADTPGCTREAIDFTRLASAFAESGTAVLGVSADPSRPRKPFATSISLSLPLASDEQHEMLEAYGVWGEKSMYGRTFHGILRTTVLIGADGRIIRIWRNVKVDGHADEVLAAARPCNLSGSICQKLTMRRSNHPRKLSRSERLRPARECRCRTVPVIIPIPPAPST